MSEPTKCPQCGRPPATNLREGGTDAFCDGTDTPECLRLRIAALESRLPSDRNGRKILPGDTVKCLGRTMAVAAVGADFATFGKGEGWAYAAACELVEPDPPEANP